MPAAIPLALIGSAVGGVASAAIGSSAAKSAANAQVDAANQAANLQHQDAQDSLNFNKLQYGNSLALGEPYYNMGTASLGRLGFLMGLTPNQGLPPGVVNPNAPASTNRFTPGRMGINPGTGFNPIGSDNNNFDPVFGSRGAGPRPLLGDGTAGNSVGTFNRFSAASPFSDTNGAQLNPANMPAGFTPAGPSGQGIPAGPDGLQLPANATQPGQGPASPDAFPGNPDAGTFNSNGAPVGATTNQGGTGQVAVNPNATSSTNAATPGGFGSLAQNFGEQWQAPTGVTEVNDPGYQFRINQGLQSVQNSAAARGKLVSGDTAKALNDYAQNSASGEFQNVYNRSLNDYTTRYNAFNQDQNTQFNRFATLSGLGQTAAGQLTNAGLSAANTNANINLTSGAQIGQDLQNAGAARGSGYVGSANAITGGISGISNIAALLALMQKNGGSPLGAS